MTQLIHNFEKPQLWQTLIGTEYECLKELFNLNPNLILKLHHELGAILSYIGVRTVSYKYVELVFLTSEIGESISSFFYPLVSSPNRFIPNLNWDRSTGSLSMCVDIGSDYEDRQRMNWWTILFYVRYIEFHAKFLQELEASNLRTDKQLYAQIKAVTNSAKFTACDQPQKPKQQCEWAIDYVKSYGINAQKLELAPMLKANIDQHFPFTEVLISDPELLAYYFNASEVLDIIRQTVRLGDGVYRDFSVELLIRDLGNEYVIRDMSYSPEDDVIYIEPVRCYNIVIGQINDIRKCLTLAPLEFKEVDGKMLIPISCDEVFNYNQQVFNLAILHLLLMWRLNKREQHPATALFPNEQPKSRYPRTNPHSHSYPINYSEMRPMRANTAKSIKYDISRVINTLYDVYEEQTATTAYEQLQNMEPCIERINLGIGKHEAIPQFNDVIRACSRIEVSSLDPLNIHFHGNEYSNVDSIADLISIFLEKLLSEKERLQKINGVFSINEINHRHNFVCLKINTDKVLTTEDLTVIDYVYMYFVLMVYNSYSVYARRELKGSTRNTRLSNRTYKGNRHSPRPPVNRYDTYTPDSKVVESFTEEDKELIIHRAYKVTNAIKLLTQNLNAEQPNAVSIADDLNDIVHGIESLFNYFQPFSTFRRYKEYPSHPKQVSTEIFLTWLERLENKITQIIDPETMNKPNVFDLLEIEKWIYLKELDMYTWVITGFGMVDDKEPKDA